MQHCIDGIGANGRLVAMAPRDFCAEAGVTAVAAVSRIVRRLLPDLTRRSNVADEWRTP